MMTSFPPLAACHRVLRARKRSRFLGVFILLWSGLRPDVAQAEGSDSFCRNVDEKSSALLDSRLPESFKADVDTVRKLVWKLHDQFEIPLSFIEDRAVEPIALPAAEQTLEEVLRAIADRHERYRCEAFAGRLVLRSTDPVFDVMISGVDVVEEYRFPARSAYINHLRAFDQRFKDWHSLWATAGDSPVFEGRVTLSPRAPVVLHLVQLLGRNRDLYFEILAPSHNMPWRIIRFGAVRRPWERRPPLAPPTPADETGEKQ